MVCLRVFGWQYKFSEARIALEERYWPITEITERFNRQSVSYQLSKRDCLHKWLKIQGGVFS